MRVAILGIGGIGRILASELRGDDRVTSILLADKVRDRARVMTGMPGRVSMEAKQLNVEDHGDLVKALKSADVVVNATLPRYNLTVMRAALEAGVNYLDAYASGPREPRGVPGILEQLELHDDFRRAGLTALISMGFDPGMTNVLARDAADRLDSIDAIRIRSGGIVNLPGFESLPLYSRDAFLSDILLPPTIWLDGKVVERAPLAEAEDFEFPAPLGRRRAFLISHEEFKTLPRFLGKRVTRVDFKLALDPVLVEALHALDRLGVLDENRRIHVGGQETSFRRALLEALPEPSALVARIEGWQCVSVIVEGTKGGSHMVLRSDISFSHQEAARRRSTAAVYYLVAVGAAIGVGMLGQKALPPGVYPPEVLPPDRMLQEWIARGLPFERAELTSTG